MNVCMRGAGAGYPHRADCPFPLYRGDDETMARWVREHDALLNPAPARKGSRYPAPLVEQPDFEELIEWQDDGGCMATDGDCWVEPDGVCEHGYPSWLLYLGMI